MTDRNCTTSSTPNQTNRYTTASFVEKSKSVHGDRYDYSKVKLINMTCSVVITCRKHGDFHQGAGIHSRGSGCSKCAEESRRLNTKSTKDGFIERATEKHGDKFCYKKVKYKNTRTDVVITCRKHGDFNQKPASHISGTGCPVCKGSNKMNTARFVAKAKDVHGVRYDYRLTEFTRLKDGLFIICLYHGAFNQIASVHLKGSGCPKCSHSLSGWSRTDFKKHCITNNKGMGTLYVIKCWLDNESFYKVGITSKSIKRRFPSKKDMPYNYDVVRELVGDSDEIYNLENRLLAMLDKTRYIPKVDFKGKHECFSDISAIDDYLSDYQ